MKSVEDIATWLPHREALELLEVAGLDRTAAIDAIIRRLSAGVMTAAAEHSVWRPAGGATEERARSSLVPVSHWSANKDWLANASLWDTGDLDFDVISGDQQGFAIEGRASYFGIRFDPEGVSSIAGSRASTERRLKSQQPHRLPNERWRCWIAELVCHIHEVGVPEGVGSQGQGDLIKAVDQRLIDRNEATLSRSTVQPVVQAVLDRIRTAETKS